MSPLASLLSSWVLTAFWPILGKGGTGFFSSALFTQSGVVIGLMAISPWLLLKGRWRKIFSPKYRFSFFMMGILGSGISSLLYMTAVQYTTSANAAIMAQIEVIYSAALCAVILKERISRPQAAGSFLVILGTGIIMVRDLSTPRWKGDLIILLTPWMYQISHIFAKRLPDDLDAVTLAGGRLFYAALSLLPFSIWTLAHHPRWSLAPVAVGYLIAQGLAACSMNHVTWYMAIRRMDLAKATAIMLSYPALTLLFSWVLGQEKIHIIQLLGLALTLSGAYWVSILVLRAHPQQPPEAFFEG